MTDDTAQATLAHLDPDLVPIPRLRYYSAGFIFEASGWRTFALRGEAFGAYNVAKWTALPDAEPEDPDFAAAWLDNVEEILSADVLVIGGTTVTPLRGALVEAGIALGVNIPVIAIGKHPSFGNWFHHPAVIQVADETEALAVLSHMADLLAGEPNA